MRAPMKRRGQTRLQCQPRGGAAARQGASPAALWRSEHRAVCYSPRTRRLLFSQVSGQKEAEQGKSCHETGDWAIDKGGQGGKD